MCCSGQVLSENGLTMPTALLVSWDSNCIEVDKMTKIVMTEAALLKPELRDCMPIWFL